MESIALTLPTAKAPQHRLRVAVVSETYTPEINGVALTTERLVNGLLSLGHHVQLIRPRQSGESLPLGQPVSSHVHENLTLVVLLGLRIPCYRHLQLGLPGRRTLQRLWHQQPPDVVHIVTEGPLGASALRLTQQLQIPVLSGFHTNFQHYSRYYRLGFLHNTITRYLRWFHNRCQCTLVPTQELAEELQGLGFRNLGLLARGVDTTLFSPQRRRQDLRAQWGLGDQDLAVLHVGRLAAEKNLGLALRAFGKIREVAPGARFILVGDGPLGTQLRLTYPNVIFAGTQQGVALAEHYASADMFLFPSLTETFGNVTLEAMASGLGVVAFDYAAARQHIVENRNGMRVSYGDDTAFISAAQRLASWPEQLRHMGREARRTTEDLDWSIVSGDLEALLLEHAQPGAHSHEQ